MEIVEWDDHQTVKLLRLDNCIFVWWTGVPTSPQMNKFASWIENNVLGLPKPLFYINQHNPNLSTPSKDDVKLFVEFAAKLFPHFEKVQFVFEGEDYKQVATRTLIRGLLTTARLGNLVFGLKIADISRKIHLHDSMKDALLDLNVQAKSSPASMLAELRQRKINVGTIPLTY